MSSSKGKVKRESVELPHPEILVPTLLDFLAFLKKDVTDEYRAVEVGGVRITWLHGVNEEHLRPRNPANRDDALYLVLRPVGGVSATDWFRCSLVHLVDPFFNEQGIEVLYRESDGNLGLFLQLVDEYHRWLEERIGTNQYNHQSPIAYYKRLG